MSCPHQSHLNSQHQADKVYHHLLVGQLNADESQQAVERLVVLLYVRFLLTAQVDVPVELLGVLEIGRRVRARPWWQGKDRRGKKNRKTNLKRAGRPCVPHLHPQGEDACQADPADVNTCRSAYLGKAGSSLPATKAAAQIVFAKSRTQCHCPSPHSGLGDEYDPGRLTPRRVGCSFCLRAVKEAGGRLWSSSQQ